MAVWPKETRGLHRQKQGWYRYSHVATPTLRPPAVPVEVPTDLITGRVPRGIQFAGSGCGPLQGNAGKLAEEDGKLMEKKEGTE